MPSNSVRTRRWCSPPTATASPDFHGEPAVDFREFHIDWDMSAAEKGGYEYFMLKEIAEQPAAVSDTLLGHFADGRIVLDEQRLSDRSCARSTRCSSSPAAPRITRAAGQVRHRALDPASRRGRAGQRIPLPRPGLDGHTLVVAISQSGETADTLEAVRHAKEQKAKVLAICNTNGSQIPRECDAVLYTRAGPEIGVASTKTFLAQIAANYPCRACSCAGPRYQVPDEVEREYRALEAMPDLIARVAGDLRRTGVRVGPPVLTVADGAVPRSPRRLPPSRLKVRSSSRNWRTCTPRGSPQVSSSTDRSR